MAKIITPSARAAPTDLKCKLNPERAPAPGKSDENALAPARRIGQTGLPLRFFPPEAPMSTT
ncbi:hypothetical protein, partial [Mesorhizobium sp. M7D.F.Ca.US.004.03.1.1]|uniref:hypothetical protein n=1 Tax=Mesorhizobium sp. M7D.F.Ca.US.004.03.1.1 TaxID=2496702 RepID=UPI0019D29A3E